MYKRYSDDMRNRLACRKLIKGHKIDTEALKKPPSFCPKKMGAATPYFRNLDSNNFKSENSDK